MMGEQWENGWRERMIEAKEGLAHIVVVTVAKGYNLLNRTVK